MPRLASLACLASLLTVVCHAAEVGSASPPWLRVGQVNEVIVQGGDLRVENDEDPQLWTSFPATWEVVDDAKRDRNRVVFRIRPAADAPSGVGAIRAYNSQGVSHPYFVWLEHAPIVAMSAETNAENAKVISLPAAVAGVTPDRRLAFYRFRAEAGERISAEIIGQRIGIDFDPVMTLLDAKRRMIAVADDDDATDEDCRLTLKIERAGEYLLVVHDVQFRGGRPFLLRLGRFPIPVNAFPLSIARGSPSTLQIADLDGEVRDLKITLPASTPFDLHEASDANAMGSTVRIVVDSREPFVESEEKERASRANSISIPAMINGQFASAGDVDRFRFFAKQRQWLTISPVTRSVHSPVVLRLKLFDDADNVVLDSRDSGLEETAQRFQVPRDGEYTLEASDLLGGYGTLHRYLMQLETTRLPVSVTVPHDKKQLRHRPLAVPGGVLELPIKIARHGYNGPIQLAAFSSERPLVVENGEVAAGANDVPLRIQIPKETTAITLAHLNLSGSAEIEGVRYETSLNVRSLIQQYTPRPRSLPLAAGAAVTAAIIPPTFAPRVEAVKIKQGESVQVPVSLEWTSPRREAVQLAARGLPANCRVEAIENLSDQKTTGGFRLVTTDQTPLGIHQAKVETIGHLHGQPFRMELPWTITVVGKSDDEQK